MNAALVGATALVAAVVARDRLADIASGDGLLVLGLTVASAILLNSLLLRARLAPMARLVEAMTHVDLARPGMRVTTPGRSAREVHELTDAFNRMLTRLEVERREAGRAVLRAQEQERSRIAQDLHDEVNQALTAILLRLSATIGDAPWGLRSELHETQELVSQAMDELLALARQLRPTALDDHGLVAALASQVSDFGQRSGMQARFHHHGEVPTLSDEEQLVIFRVTQESLSNIAKHARARVVDVELSFVGRTVLRVRDDGHGFDPAPAHRINGRLCGRPGGLGLSGMRERALLVGGSLHVFTAPDEGTTIELTMGVT
ncbi:MAG TPA: HAMP domain-containing sensor histidine kinase [Solirubrobacteraceae bacterium]|nr:HAMP domain-containing sensor histidine kinase [Solirubrobacteraceae bacterium]